MHLLLHFLRFDKLSTDTWLERKYYDDPDSCDLSELMVVTNVISGRKDIVRLFWENKLGVDVDVNVLHFIYLAMVFNDYRTTTASSCSRDWNI